MHPTVKRAEGVSLGNASRACSTCDARFFLSLSGNPYRRSVKSPGEYDSSPSSPSSPRMGEPRQVATGIEGGHKMIKHPRYTYAGPRS